MTLSYQPGVCNIGPAEIRMRRVAGTIAAVVTLLMLIGFVVFDVADSVRWIITLPAAGAAIGFLQAGLHFCVRFGMSGLFNFGDLGTQDSVMEAEFRAKDQRKAVIIVLGAVLIAAAVGVLATLLP